MENTPDNSSVTEESQATQGRNFIRAMIERDLETAKYNGKAVSYTHLTLPTIYSV